MKIGTLTTGNGTATTFNLQYVPEILHFAAATVPASIKVNVLGYGVICDLDADGIGAASELYKKGSVTNGFSIPLANGVVLGKECEITIVNSAAQTPDIYVYSTRRANLYIKSSTFKVFASTQRMFDDFFALSIPDFDSGNDDLDITFTNVVQKMEPEDLRNLAAYEGIVTNSDDDFKIQNADMSVKGVSYIPAVDTNCYKFAYVGIE